MNSESKRIPQTTRGFRMTSMFLNSKPSGMAGDMLAENSILKMKDQSWKRTQGSAFYVNSQQSYHRFQKTQETPALQCFFKSSLLLETSCK